MLEEMLRFRKKAAIKFTRCFFGFLFIILLGSEGSATSETILDEPIPEAGSLAPVKVFKRTNQYCYRSPSLELMDATLFAVAQRRHGFLKSEESSEESSEEEKGEFDLCNDAGNIDLVLKQSTNSGKTWSAEKVVASSEAIRNKLLNRNSIFWDPSLPQGMPPEKLYVKLGYESLSSSGGKLILMFGMTYNIFANSNNSEDALNAGEAKFRIFKAISYDKGDTWTIRSVHDEIYKSCAKKVIAHPALQDMVLRLFPSENYRERPHALVPSLASAALDSLNIPHPAKIEKYYSQFPPNYEKLFTHIKKYNKSEKDFFAKYQRRMTLDVTRKLASLYGDKKLDEAALLWKSLGINPSVAKSYAYELELIFEQNNRIGPGNGVRFTTAGGKERVFFSGEPFAFYTDNGGLTFHCSDTRKIEKKGSERQTAHLGGKRLVMTLRPVPKYAKPDGKLRLFSISDDEGLTWSKTFVIESGSKKVLVDPQANGSLISIAASNGKRQLFLSHISNISDPLPGANPDLRYNLTLTKFTPGTLNPILGDKCSKYDTWHHKKEDKVVPNTIYKKQYTIKGSAGYSVMMEIGSTIGLLYEAGSTLGETCYRCWNRAIWFRKIPKSVIGVGNPSPSCQ